MKKNLLFIAATALVFAGCSEEKMRTDIQDEQVGIGFTTFSSKLTRGTTITDASENTGSTTVNNLEAYNSSFKVWSSKYVGSALTPSVVFTAQVVNYNTTSTDWEYTPLKFWDKSAKKYDFYAASPSGKSWVWDNTNKKLSLADFVVSGTNRVTATSGTGTSVFGVTTSIAADAVMSFENEDLMVSNDITEYKDYTNTAVQLHFNHILSRLNIGVRKSNDLNGFTVKLKAIEVYNMVNKGTFNETAAAVATGTTARWTPSSTATDKFTTPMSYTNNSGLEITSNETSNTYQYVYEGLVIPQTADYNPTVLVNEYDHTVTNPSQFRMDGQDAVHAGTAEDSNPYIVIKYEIWTTAETPVMTDSYEYYYNLADVFNGPDSGATANDAIDFNEGWQNTLKITLAPAAINFDADVYEWANGTETAVNIE